MNFIRRYLVFLAPVGITIFSAILFVPTLLTGRSINKEMEASIAQGRKLKSMRSNTPPKMQAEVEKVYQSEHKKDVDEILQLSRRSTQRELIDYGLFPKPKDTSQQVFANFGVKYRAAIEDLIKSMGALDAPSDIDIRKETELETGATGRVTAGQFGRLGTHSSSITKKGSRGIIVGAVCDKRAESVLVYANPNSLAWYGFWSDYKYSGLNTSLKDCWNSQVAYWIYEDVMSTIKALNTGSDCVYNSSVKRLVGVSFSRPVEYVEPVNMATSVADEPAYIIDKGASILGVEPWTGRVCDDAVDVVHFCVSVIVDSKAFMSFIRELCSEKEHRFKEGYSASGQEKVFRHNQITVLQSKIEPVDRTSTQHEYYRYGDGAVVQMSLVCEYIFHRSGYDVIKPEPVKELLGQSEAKKDASQQKSP